MKRYAAIAFVSLAFFVFAHAVAGQDESVPEVLALVLQDATAGAESAKLDEWVVEELKKEKIGAIAIGRPWFRLTNQAVTLHDTKLHGTLTIRLPEARDAETLTVLLAGSKPQQVQLPRKDGSAKLVRTELENHLGDKLAFYIALRVEKATAGGPAPLQIGADSGGKTVEVKGVARVLILLPGNITTGYSWAIARIEGDAVKADGEVQYAAKEQKPGLVGGGGTFEASLLVVAKGKATVTLEYRRPWEKEKPAEKTFTVTLDVQDVPSGK